MSFPTNHRVRKECFHVIRRTKRRGKGEEGRERRRERKNLFSQDVGNPPGVTSSVGHTSPSDLTTAVCDSFRECVHHASPLSLGLVSVLP